jgi:hypothetical protein
VLQEGKIVRRPRVADEKFVLRWSRAAQRMEPYPSLSRPCSRPLPRVETLQRVELDLGRKGWAVDGNTLGSALMTVE